MPLTLRGNALTTPTPVRFSEGRRNSDGTLETDVTFAVATGSLMTAVASVAQRGVSTHPHWSNFKADLYSWSTPVQGVTLLRVFYLAIIESTLTPGQPLPLDVEEEADNTVSEEPIQTLPNFLVAADGRDPICPLFEADGTTAASWPTVGSPAYPVTVNPATGRWPGFDEDGNGEAYIVGNQAVFDTFGQNKDPNANDYNPNVGRFLYFAPGSPFVGQEAYVVSRGQWSFSYATANQPNLSNAGKIGTPPGVAAPTAPVNYLCAAMRYRRTGFVYRAAQNWRRSGPRGWNPKTYTTIT
jgi:hypothetical protein